MFKPESFLNDLIRVLQNRGSPRKDYAYLNRLVMIIIVYHFVASVNHQQVTL